MSILVERSAKATQTVTPVVVPKEDLCIVVTVAMPARVMITVPMQQNLLRSRYRIGRQLVNGKQPEICQSETKRASQHTQCRTFHD